MLRKILVFACISFGPAFAQKTDPVASKDATPHTPQITAEQRSQFWRAQAELLSLKIQQQEAERKLNETLDTMRKICKDMTLTTADNGEPICRSSKQ